MPHISFSELKIWNECAWKHKLVYLEKIKAFQGNEYTAFGTALHSVCESLVEGKFAKKETNRSEFEAHFDVHVPRSETYFQEQFLKELKELPHLKNTLVRTNCSLLRSDYLSHIQTLKKLSIILKVL